MTACQYGLGPERCPASPFCGCDRERLPSPLPDPDQLDIYDVLEDDE